jgi:hypothetical protein
MIKTFKNEIYDKINNFSQEIDSLKNSIKNSKEELIIDYNNIKNDKKKIDEELISLKNIIQNQNDKIEKLTKKINENTLNIQIIDNKNEEINKKLDETNSFKNSTNKNIKLINEEIEKLKSIINKKENKPIVEICKLSREIIPIPNSNVNKKKFPNCYRYEPIKNEIVTKEPILKISENEEENIIKTKKINVINSKDKNINIHNNEKDLEKNLTYQKNPILTNSKNKILGSDFLTPEINENERLSKSYLFEDKSDNNPNFETDLFNTNVFTSNDNNDFNDNNNNDFNNNNNNNNFNNDNVYKMKNNSIKLELLENNEQNNNKLLNSNESTDNK